MIGDRVIKNYLFLKVGQLLKNRLINVCNKANIRHISVFLFFILASVLFFLPWIYGDNDFLLAIPGDPYGTIWYFWQTNHFSSPTELIAAPFGYQQGPVIFYLWWALSLLFGNFINEINTYNFLVFISFPFAGFTMYLLVWHVIHHRLASLIAGLIFAFSPYHLMHSLQHLTLGHIQWLPLFFLALIKLREQATLNNYIALVVSFIILFMSDYYYGYFTLLITAPLVLFILYNRRKDKQEVEEGQININQKAVYMAAIVGILILSAAVFPIISNWQKTIGTMGRTIIDLQVYTARPLEYITPSIDNLFFGRFAEKFSSARLHGSNFFEQTLYLGFLPLALAGLALFTKKNRHENSFIIYFSLIGALIALLFSAPPKVNFLGFNIPMPSYFAHQIMPTFRVYARFGVFVSVFVALLAGIGFKQLIGNFRSYWTKATLVSITLIFITAEFLSIPSQNISTNVPKVYSWLAKQPDNFIAAEYPLVSSSDYYNNEYLFYQRVHKKRLANGAAPDSYAERMRRKLEDLEEPDIGIRLRRLGVKYVIVHRQKYKEGMIPDNIKRYHGGSKSVTSQIKYNNGKIPLITTSNMKLIKRFGSDDVYVIEAAKGIVYAWQNNFYAGESLMNSKRRWMSNNGKLQLANYSKKPIVVDININMFSFMKQRNIDVYLDSKFLTRYLVDAKPKDFTIKKIRLKPGVNQVVFKANPGADVADDVIHNGDKRKISINFSSLMIGEN